jgi:hypothetical protein
MATKVLILSKNEAYKNIIPKTRDYLAADLVLVDLEFQTKEGDLYYVLKNRKGRQGITIKSSIYKSNS